MNTHVRDNLLHLYERYVKGATETVNNSTTLQDDDDFAFAIGANEIVPFHMWIRGDSNATADFKWAFSVPSGGGGVVLQTAYGGAGVGSSITPFAISSGTGIQTNAGFYIYFTGFAQAAATPGTVQFQWAQNTLDASDTTVQAGSWLQVIRQ